MPGGLEATGPEAWLGLLGLLDCSCDLTHSTLGKVGGYVYIYKERVSRWHGNILLYVWHTAILEKNPLRQIGSLRALDSVYYC